MFSPIKWIKPRLKSLCVAFGAADMTLVVLSIICWYLVYDSAFRAQDLRNLFNAVHPEHQGSTEASIDNPENDNTITNVPSNPHEYNEDAPVIRRFREDRSAEELRLERTVRACGYQVEHNHLDESISNTNYAGSAALIGAAMGGFFVLGALLMSLNAIVNAAARRVICLVALFGEGISSFFLFVGITLLGTNGGLCRTEYYYETFPPVLYLLIFTLIFIFTYKTYELTVIAFYLGTQATIARKEQAEMDDLHKSKSKQEKQKNNTKDTKLSQRGTIPRSGNTSRDKREPTPHPHHKTPPPPPQPQHHRQPPPKESSKPHRTYSLESMDSTISLTSTDSFQQEHRRHFRHMSVGGPQPQMKGGGEPRDPQKSAERRDHKLEDGSEKRKKRLPNDSQPQKDSMRDKGKGHSADERGGGEGSGLSKPGMSSPHYHHPLHPTKKRATNHNSNQQALDNFSNSVRTDSAINTKNKEDQRQKRALTKAVSEFNELGRGTENEGVST